MYKDLTELRKMLDGAELFLRNRANCAPAPLNKYDIEALKDISNLISTVADKIENGTLIEIPSIRYSERFEAWVLYYMDRECLQTCIMTKEQAEQKLKELKNEG